MSVKDEDQVFTTEAIRDTNDHNSVVSVTGEFRAETIAVINGLNQTVTFQLQGSRDKTNWFDIGGTFNVAASGKDYQTVTDYFPFYRLVVFCDTSPTTGVLDVWILKAMGNS